MAYRVISVVRKKGPQFKIMYEWWEARHRKYKAVPKSDWMRHGFTETMTLEEAKARRDSLNAGERKYRTEFRRQRILERLEGERTNQLAYFPADWLDEFESSARIRKTPKAQSYWNTARRILDAAALPPEKWISSPEQFYKQFLERKMSRAYIKKVLPMINAWGLFQSRKQLKPFDPVPYPPKHWLDEISEAYYDKDNIQGGRESSPLSLERLVASEAHWHPAEYRWLRFSVLFGLRPSEVDILNKPSDTRTWSVEPGAVPIFCLYQKKLKGVAPDKRTKRIPAILPAQQELLRSEGPVKRPGRKKIIAAFGESITLYGGRKNFIQFMKSQGQRFENISAWLGHMDLRRTYQHYFNKQETSFDPVPS